MSSGWYRGPDTEASACKGRQISWEKKIDKNIKKDWETQIENEFCLHHEAWLDGLSRDLLTLVCLHFSNKTEILNCIFKIEKSILDGLFRLQDRIWGTIINHLLYQCHWIKVLNKDWNFDTSWMVGLIPIIFISYGFARSQVFAKLTLWCLWGKTHFISLPPCPNLYLSLAPLMHYLASAATFWLAQHETSPKRHHLGHNVKPTF